MCGFRHKQRRMGCRNLFETCFVLRNRWQLALSGNVSWNEVDIRMVEGKTHRDISIVFCTRLNNCQPTVGKPLVDIHFANDDSLNIYRHIPAALVVRRRCLRIEMALRHPWQSTTLTTNIIEEANGMARFLATPNPTWLQLANLRVAASMRSAVCV